MKTLIRWATIALAAAGLSVVAPLTAAAEDDYNAPNSNNCMNVRTLTTSRCVHYSERAKDGWATQQGEIQRQTPGDDPSRYQGAREG
jgi:hypothetical protein